MVQESSSHVTHMLSIIVDPNKIARYEAWLPEAETINRRHEGFLGMDVIKPRSHIEPEYIILLRFATAEDLEAWHRSEDIDEVRRQASEFLIAKQVAEKSYGLTMMFERPPTSHFYPKPAYYKQVLIATLTVFPIVLVLNVTIAPFLQELPGPLATLISVLAMAPIMTAIMPRVSKLFIGWLYPPPNSKARAL